MVSIEEVRVAVEKAKEMLSDSGIDVEVTADQVWDWLETDLPTPDLEIGDVVLDPLVIVHGIIEIDELLKVGLSITKNLRLEHPENVEDAHLKAAKVELMVARAIGATEHLEERIKDIEQWSIDKTLTDRRRAEYEQLLAEAKRHLERLTFTGG